MLTHTTWWCSFVTMLLNLMPDQIWPFINAEGFCADATTDVLMGWAAGCNCLQKQETVSFLSETSLKERCVVAYNSLS